MKDNRKVSAASKKRGGVQSIDVGMHLFKTLASIRGDTTLNELAGMIDMHPAKVHRYLVSLSESGLVEQTARGRYDLGPYILELATSYLSRLDPMAIAGPMIEDLWAQTNEGVILCVWGEAGTTVVRWMQSRRPISVGIRPGSIFSTTMSASGRVFLAYLPPQLTKGTVEFELQQFAIKPNPLAPKSLEEVDAIIDETRTRGLARVEGHSVEYVSAVAAPVFDYKGNPVLALALFGFKSEFDVDWDGDNARMVKQTAAAISGKLGYISESR